MHYSNLIPSGILLGGPQQFLPASEILPALASRGGYSALPHTACWDCSACSNCRRHCPREPEEDPLQDIFHLDVWTSAPGDPYLSLTAHFIDAPADSPTAWELKSNQLIFQEIEGRHMGKNMNNILGHALDRYGLRGKVWLSHFFITTYWSILQVGWFTSDSAAVNHTTLCLLQNSLIVGAGWTARDYDMLYVFTA